MNWQSPLFIIQKNSKMQHLSEPERQSQKTCPELATDFSGLRNIRKGNRRLIRHSEQFHPSSAKSSSFPKKLKQFTSKDI